jgi:predicted nucleic-acid-binding Zn-ribbon protein
MTQDPQSTRMWTCPLCQNSEFEQLELVVIGGHGGQLGGWSIRNLNVRGFMSHLINAKRGMLKAMRCTNCHHVLLFAEDQAPS